MALRIDDDSTPLIISDHRFQESIKTLRKIDFEAQRWFDRRECVIRHLQTLLWLIMSSYQKRTISKVAGASAATVGSVLGIVGFGLSFVTLGASLGLLIPGAIIGGAGAITMASADIGDQLVSEAHMKAAKKAIEDDRDHFNRLCQHAEKLNKNVEELRLDYPCMLKEKILTTIVFHARGIFAGAELANGIKNVISNGAYVGKLTLNVCKLGRIARILFPGLNAVAGPSASIGGVVFDSVGIPLNLITIIKGSVDIHKHRTGQGTNSKAANHLWEIISLLEAHKDKIKSNFIITE